MEFRLQGGDRIESSLEKFSSALGDFRPLWPARAAAFHSLERQMFQSGGALLGVGWQPLGAPSARWKQIHFPGAPLMTRSGRLRDSLITSGAPGSIEEASATELRLGSSLPYAAAQHYGAPERGLPARPLIPDPDEPFLGDLWQRVMEDYFGEFFSRL